jgi:hypothetical protein
MNLTPILRVSAALALVLGTQGCSTLDGQARAASSSGTCARAAIADIHPDAAGDKHAHCVGAARIAQRCSVAEAILASYAKEMRDLFGRGNAELADVHAGRAGIGCARSSPAAVDVARCCEARGY